MRRMLRPFRRLAYDGRTMAAICILLVVIGTTGLLVAYNRFMADRIDPTAYTLLLDTIAKGESQGNYNAYYGNSGNSSLDFTKMSVEQVLLWQQAYVDQGSPSSAVGKYQIVRPTLAGLVEKLHIKPEAKFDAELQDALAISLLEKRGATDYMHDQISRETFAANLAKEWAALPKVVGQNPDQSYYAGDGLNQSHITVDEILKVLAAVRSTSQKSENS
jgi:conjugal transfer mating pair stabilization protein TraG